MQARKNKSAPQGSTPSPLIPLGPSQHFGWLPDGPTHGLGFDELCGR
jgi:hypothetical protein